MSSYRHGVREFGALVTNVLDATRGLAPWQLPQSVLGRLRGAMPPTGSEYAMFLERDIARSIAYLANVGIPSLQRAGPGWLPRTLRQVFFHESTIREWPDPSGDYDSFPAEHWFFINGILTDAGMAGWNADYLARLFHRPVTIIQNATDGPIADLLECADEKAFGMNGEPADIAFPELHRALKDPSRTRIVVIAHSQGTLIAAVLVRLLRLLYAGDGQPGTPHEDLEALRRSGVTLDPDDFEAVTREELERLEIYCFANCANEMHYVDADRALPWIESFGNEHDLVARLGMLAPNLAAENIEIDGPLWVRHGGWGHLLNHHYLRPIDAAQVNGTTSGPRGDGPEPFVLYGGAGSPQAPGAPRLYRYINGGFGDAGSE